MNHGFGTHMDYKIKTTGDYKYIDEGHGENLLLLHGLFGALSNWEGVIEGFRQHYRVLIPMLPIYEMNPRDASCESLATFVEGFIDAKDLNNLTLLGNSLGGHVGLIYTLRFPEKVKRLVLTGSSGLFEDGMGGSYPRRGSYDFIQEKVAYTFYDPKVATKELIDEVFETVNDNRKAMSIVCIAKSAQRTNMASEIVDIACPTLLIWGLNDTITPPAVGYEFNKLIKNSELHFIDKCCHAPMMEHPLRFNEILSKWLSENSI
jgi:pimeloyl-ACP methyl ester carboxylesterase